MNFERIKHLAYIGINTFLSSVIFFYSHGILVFISLLPSLVRAYQMWFHLNTPIWLEIIVEGARIILFMLILTELSGVKINRLFRKDYWDQLKKVSSDKFNKNWPHIFTAQLIIFIVVLFGFMNFLIQIMVNSFQDVLMNIFDSQDPKAAHNSLLFFLKNMSVIPISMVYILKMCGVSSVDNK